jgi:DNA-binding NtrC family response regulator
MANSPDILIVDDEAKMRTLLSIMLERQGYKVDQAENGKEALRKVSSFTYDLVISDIKMPEMDGQELIINMRKKDIVTPVVFITAFATVDSAVNMMRHGAADYVIKPFDESKIIITVERALKLSALVSENQEMKLELEKTKEPRKLIYKSGSMEDVVELVKNVASVDTAVLIRGESGTGKEIIARHIHSQSSRCNKRFVPVNCAAISSNLVESELFGYEKGAFTGAESRRRGKFEYATGGTLFLDEIGDMPIESQGKLLRALQERKFQRVGGNEEIPVDVRIICATNRNLETMVNQNKFRQDLYYRINVFPILIPSLRERKEDVIPLAKYIMGNIPFGKKHSISDGACQKLKEYPWPGNVRELSNVIERCIILTRTTQKITSETLSFLRPEPPADSHRTIIKLPPGGIELQKVQVSLVKQALDAAGNNQTSAAKLLGLSRSKLRVFLKKIDGE